MTDPVQTPGPTDINLFDYPVEGSQAGRVASLVFLTIGCLIAAFAIAAFIAFAIIPLIPPGRSLSFYVPWVLVPILLGFFFMLHRLDRRHTETAACEAPFPPSAETLRKIFTGSILSWGLHLRTATRSLSARG